jgi:hypothetical protein
MIKPGGGPRLAQGTLAKLVSLGSAELRRPDDLLDRDMAAQQLVRGTPENAHPAAAYHRVQPVPPSDQGTRLSTIHLRRLPRPASS